MPNIDQVNTYLELNLKECGKEVCIPSKKIVYSKKSYYLFHYVVSGKGHFKICGNEYHLKKGTIFVIPPNCDCQYSPDPKDPWTYIWVGFNGILVKQYLDQIGINNENFIIKVNDQLNLKSYFENIYNEYFTNSYLNVVCLGMFYQLCGTLLKNAKINKHVKLSGQSYIDAACEFIRNNYQFDIKINDIANSIGVAPNYLTNVFHSQYGLPPKKYLTKVRMEKSTELLKQENYKIKEIASLVGYKNQLHFSSEFKKYFGESPYNFVKEQKFRN